MALNDYTVALLTAIQNGTAYIVPNKIGIQNRPAIDKNGVIGSAKIHFPGEENYTLPKTLYNSAGTNGSEGFMINRTVSSGKGDNTLYDSEAGFSLPPVYGGQEGTLADITIQIGKNNNVLPSNDINKLITVRDSGGPTTFSQVATALFPTVANIALPGVGTAFSAINSIAQGADVTDVLKNIAINQGINQGLSALSNIVPPTVDLNAATAGLQNVYGGALPIEDIAAAFDTVSPLADTTVALDTTAPVVPTVLDTAFVQDMSQGIEQPSPLAATDTEFLQDMDQGIQPEVNLEGGDLGMTEAEAQNQYYESIGIDPSTVTDTPAVSTTGDTPETDYSETSQQDVSKSLTPQQIYNLLKIGAGLFGGAGAISTVAKNITGGITSNAPTGTILPTVKAPTPFTGTYSGMNPYDAAYFQQVQQNYNRLFPTVPSNVATPLQSWYQTQYKPDTTISNKLFGV